MTVGSRPIRNRKTRIVAGNERARDDQNESGARGEYRKAMKALIKRRGDRLQTSSSKHVVSHSLRTIKRITAQLLRAVNSQ